MNHVLASVNYQVKITLNNSHILFFQKFFGDWKLSSAFAIGYFKDI